MLRKVLPFSWPQGGRTRLVPMRFARPRSQGRGTTASGLSDAPALLGRLLGPQEPATEEEPNVLVAYGSAFWVGLQLA
jgi:hypothetical protein